MRTFFEQSIAACQDRKVKLIEDGRKDEAVFEQVRCNVFDIFQTVWNLEKGVDYFKEKLTSISMNWHTAAQKAKAYDDVRAQTLENIKLDTVQEIRMALEERT